MKFLILLGIMCIFFIDNQQVMIFFLIFLFYLFFYPHTHLIYFRHSSVTGKFEMLKQYISFNLTRYTKLILQHMQMHFVAFGSTNE